jgi:hypothetical protein
VAYFISGRPLPPFRNGKAFALPRHKIGKPFLFLLESYRGCRDFGTVWVGFLGKVREENRIDQIRLPAA